MITQDENQLLFIDKGKILCITVLVTVLQRNRINKIVR